MEHESAAVAPELVRWRAKTAVVTGASSGIGAAVARSLVGAGLRVVGCARRGERLEALAADLGEAFVPRALDLRDVGAIEAAFRDIARTQGGIDVLVNNAGLGHKAPLVSADAELWREMLEVNVLALCVCTREVVQDVKRRAASEGARGVEGHIVHISSMAAHRVPPESGVYSASKHAVRALTEALRQELWQEDAPLRVTSISPAFVETEFAAKYHGDDGAASRTYGQYRVLQPDDVAHAVLYALGQPAEVQVHDLLVRPRRQQS